MRKKTRRSPSSTRKPTPRALPLNKETIRTLGTDELGDVATGAGKICPATSATQTTRDTNTGPGGGVHQ